MKTNVNLTRQMGGFEIVQRTKDGYFDANVLLRQWNAKKGNGKRQMNRFLKSKRTLEFVDELVEREKTLSRKRVKGKNQPFMEVKGRMTKNGRASDKVWMHPLLFLKFGMYINPRFEYDVLKFVQDNLVDYRNKAGDAYKRLSSSVASISKTKRVVKNIAKTAEALNYIVCNRHIKDARNEMTETEMNELVSLELLVSQIIDDGLITEYKSLIKYLRKKWADKYSPKILNV